MSRLIINRDREQGCWSVFRLADEDDSRYVARFDTLAAAEAYVIEYGDEVKS